MCCVHRSLSHPIRWINTSRPSKRRSSAKSANWEPATKPSRPWRRSAPGWLPLGPMRRRQPVVCGPRRAQDPPGVADLKRQLERPRLPRSILDAFADTSHYLLGMLEQNRSAVHALESMREALMTDVQRPRLASPRWAGSTTGANVGAAGSPSWPTTVQNMQCHGASECGKCVSAHGCLGRAGSLQAVAFDQNIAAAL
jgi:hypothetical protein